MSARQIIIRKKYWGPKTPTSESQSFYDSMDAALKAASEAPLPEGTDPTHYSKNVQVNGSMNYSEPNGIFKLFTYGSGPFGKDDTPKPKINVRTYVVSGNIKDYKFEDKPKRKSIFRLF